MSVYDARLYKQTPIHGSKSDCTTLYSRRVERRGEIARSQCSCNPDSCGSSLARPKSFGPGQKCYSGS